MKTDRFQSAYYKRLHISLMTSHSQLTRCWMNRGSDLLGLPQQSSMMLQSFAIEPTDDFVWKKKVTQSSEHTCRAWLTQTDTKYNLVAAMAIPAPCHQLALLR